MTVTVERIEEGHRYAVGLNREYAIEMYHVGGLPVDKANGPDAEAAGLPTAMPPARHPNNARLYVYQRTTVQIISDQDCIVQVEYQHQNFSIGRTYASKQFETKPLRLPLIWYQSNPTGGSGLVQYRGQNDDSGVVFRSTLRRIVTVQAGGDIDAAANAMVNNVGKYYVLGSAPNQIPFVLQVSPIWKEPNGAVYATWTFDTACPMKAYAAGEYSPEQSVPIPSVGWLDKLDSVKQSDTTVVMRTTPYTQIYQRGSPLPGL